jgi:hypothetical protein
MLGSTLPGRWPVALLLASLGCGDATAPSQGAFDAGDGGVETLSCHEPIDNAVPGCPRTHQEGRGLGCTGSPMECAYPYAGDTAPAAGRPCPGYVRLRCNFKPMADGGQEGTWTADYSAQAGSPPIKP